MFNQLFGNNVFLLPRKQIAVAVSNAFSPFGWSQNRCYNKGNVFEEIINNPVTIITEPLKQLDQVVIQPLYHEVIQPVGHALEKVGQQIAKDPVTFVAQIAAVAAAPFTGGASLWALPVIAAASTAAHGGSIEQVLTATAISAATAYVGANASGWIMSGLSEAADIGPSFAIAGQPISYSAAQTIAQVGAGLSVASISATGAAIQGRDPLAAALPALAGTAAGAIVGQVSQLDAFKDLSASINNSGLSTTVQKALTGVAGSALTGILSGRDVTGAIAGQLAGAAIDGLASSVDVVGNLFKNDAGNITKFGSAAQGLIANVAATVVANATNAGGAGAAYTGQLTNSLAKTLVSGLDSAYNSLADTVQGLYTGATSAANTYNEAAKDQQAKLASYNSNVDVYGQKVAAYNSDYAKYQQAITDYNSMSTGAGNTQAQADAKLAEIRNYESSLNAQQASIDSMAAAFPQQQKDYYASVDATTAAQNKYFEVAKELGTQSDLLTSRTNDIASKMTQDLVKTLDPTFNADEYKKVNNLGSGVDAFTHWISTGKDEGLPTTVAAAQADIVTTKSALADQILQAQGWTFPSMAPASIRQGVMTALTSQYGDNLAALKDATPQNVTSWGSFSQGKTLDAYAPAYSSDAAKAAMYKQLTDQTLTPGWYQPASFKMPTGMTFANQQDIADMMAKGSPIATAIDNSGYTVYLKQDPNYKPIQKYDAATGDITSTASIINTITTKDMSPSEILNYVSKASQDTLTYIAKNDTAMASNVNYIDSSTLVQTLKQGADYIRTAASAENAPLIYQLMSSGLNAAGAGLAGIASVTSSATMLESMLTNTNPNDQPTMQITKYLQSMSNAVRSEDMKASIQSLNAALETKGVDVVGAVLNNAATNPAGMVNFIGENLVAMLPGFAAGKWVAGSVTAAAELQNFSTAAINKMATGAGLATDRLYELGMEVGNNALTAFNETRALLAKQNPNMSAAELDAAAMSDAKMVGATSALTTLFTQKVGLDKVSQNLFGASNVDSSTFAAVAKNLLTSTVGSASGEAMQSFLPTLTQELIMREIDPSRSVETSVGNVLGQTTLGFIAGAGTNVAVSSITSLQDIQNYAADSNGYFQKAINSAGTTLTDLGSVLNQWIPASTAGTSNIISDIRTSAVYDAIVNNPAYAANYSNASQFIDAIKTSTGVWDATQITDAVAQAAGGKFASQVTTLDQAKKMLAAQGLVNISDQDAINAGLVGVTKPNETALATQYANSNMIGLEEIQAAAKQENYNATQDEMSRLVGRGVQADVIAQFVKDIDPKAVTTAEATQYFQNLGYTKATAADIAQFVKSAPETEVQKSVAAWVDPRQVTRQEALNFYSQLGYTPTEEEIAKYVVQGPDVVQADIQKQLGAYVDPLMVDAGEVKAAYQAMGLQAPVSQADLARLTGQYAESDLAAKAKENLPVVAANAMYALFAGDQSANAAVKTEILAKIDEYKNLGMTQDEAQTAATQAVAAQLGTTKTDLLTAIGATEQNLLTTLTDTKQQILDKVSEYQSQGMAADQALQAAIDTVANNQKTNATDLLNKLGTTKTELQSQITTSVGALGKTLSDEIAKNEAAGMARDQATQAAVDSVASQLGTTRTDLLNKIDITSQQFQNAIEVAKTDINKQLTVFGQQTQQQITDAKTQIQQQMAAYEQAGMDRDTALGLAISGVAQDLGTTKADLLTQMNTSEANLRSELTAQTTALSTQVQDVAQLLGKPASQVTANDLTMVQNMIAGQTQQNMAYDVNQDQVVDAKDLALLQQQQQIQTKTNVVQTTDPVTGLPIYTDANTGQVITGFTPAAGSQWAPTGVYAALAQQQAAQSAQAAATAKAQAATAQQNQQKTNFGNMMSMLFQAPDAQGQTATVKSSDPAKINYIYDFNSIFANPAQASLMPSPYGPMNTVAPKQPQAANQPMYKAASGFAQGGIVDGNDLSVGDGGNIDDIINILKGNSG